MNIDELRAYLEVRLRDLRQEMAEMEELGAMDEEAPIEVKACIRELEELWDRGFPEI